MEPILEPALAEAWLQDDLVSATHADPGQENSGRARRRDRFAQSAKKTQKQMRGLPTSMTSSFKDLLDPLGSRNITCILE